MRARLTRQRIPESQLSHLVQCLALLLPLLPFSAVHAADRLPLHVRGDTSFLPVAQSMTEAYLREHPGTLLVLSGTGSSRAYKSLLDKSADLAIVDGPPSHDIRQLAEKRGTPLIHHQLAYAAILFVVHRDNPVTTLTRDELRMVLNGRVRNWLQVGGKNQEVHLVVDTPTSGISQTVKQHLIGEDTPFSPRSTIAHGQDKLARLVANPNSITFVMSGDIPDNYRSQVHVLQIDGVTPNSETLLNNRYPVRTTIEMITVASTDALARPFMNYMTQQRKLIETAGLVLADRSNPAKEQPQDKP
jgi:phosphate transport system substrate-binding protein